MGLSGLLPLRVEAPDLLVVMKFSLIFMAFMAFSSSVMSMSLSGTENVAPETDGDSEADWLNLLSQNRFEKRKFAANDPRDLFKSMYANYYGAGNGAGYRKRYNTQPNIETYYQAPAPPSPVVGLKRGFKNPQDPRNLFR